MNAFDLKAAANASGYRLEYDESAEIRGEDETLAWFPQIPGRDKRNFISVWSDRRLAAYTFTRRLHDKLRAIPGRTKWSSAETTSSGLRLMPSTSTPPPRSWHAGNGDDSPQSIEPNWSKPDAPTD